MTDPLDPVGVLAALGVAPPARVSPISGGWDTALWRVDDVSSHSYALRVFRPGQVQRCQREALVMRALRMHGVPVPAVHAEGMAGDRPALLLEWCPGRTLLDEVRARPWRIWQLGRAMGRVHARIHAVPVSEEVARALPPTAADVQQSSAQRALVHMDFHPLNVMIDGRSVSGVLDWANVGVGDYRADLARTVTLLRLAPMPPGTSALLQLARRMLEAAWRSGYRAHQPADPFTGMEPFYAWAGEWMERDFQPKLGSPGVWLEESDLERIRRWTAARTK